MQPKGTQPNRRPARLTPREYFKLDCSREGTPIPPDAPDRTRALLRSLNGKLPAFETHFGSSRRGTNW